MKGIWNKTAAIVALVIGAMAIFAGGKVLLGNDPGYYVIDWVPVYNFSAGVITVLITAVLLWKNHRFALAAAGATLAAHTTVMIILQTAYRSSVAGESIQAMTVRMIVWVLILLLLFIQSRSRSAPQVRIKSKRKEAL